MPWLAVLPLVIDGIRAVLRLVDETNDLTKKDELRRALNDYGTHQDVSTLQGNLDQLRR